MAIAQKPAPAIPQAKPISGKAAEEFSALKQSLNMASWEMAPNSWDAVQIAYTKKGNEQQARSFAKAIEPASQEIL
jgi:hypothetical protein